MSDNEKDINELIRNFQNQQSNQMGRMNVPPHMQGNPNQDTSYLGNNPVLNQRESVDMHAGIDNQGANYVDGSLHTNKQHTQTAQNMNIAPSSPPKPVHIEGGCRECGMIHPPLRQGEKCPNAMPKAKTADGEEKIIDVNKYLNNLRNILISQISMKGIQDVDKLFKNITLEITKYLETYKD